MSPEREAELRTWLNRARWQLAGCREGRRNEREHHEAEAAKLREENARLRDALATARDGLDSALRAMVVSGRAVSPDIDEALAAATEVLAEAGKERE